MNPFEIKNKLSREFYDRDTTTVAKELLGHYLVCHIGQEKRIGRIVEVEAYLGAHDLACHAAKGLTERTKIMFGPPGYAYVYMIYGMYHCLNVVTENTGHPAAILLRALEPMHNIQQRTQGPGLLCKALGVTRQHNGHDLLSSDFYIAKAESETPFSIVKRPRIGIDYAGNWKNRLLRFYIKNNSFISKP